MILTILAGIGAIAITQFKVRPHIQGIIDERNRQTQRGNSLDASLKKTKNQLSQTEGELQNTKKELDNTQTQLTTTKEDLKNMRANAEKLEKTLVETQASERAAKQELSAWKALGLPVEQVAALIEGEKRMRAEIDALTAEKQIINDQLSRANEKIRIYEEGKGPDIEVPLPAGLRGRVLVVDEKWQFVVLSLGRKDHVEPNGVLLVSRDGRLVAKVKIKRVQEDRSIANVMPGWSFDAISEGDVVLN